MHQGLLKCPQDQPDTCKHCHQIQKEFAAVWTSLQRVIMARRNQHGRQISCKQNIEYPRGSMDFKASTTKFPSCCAHSRTQCTPEHRSPPAWQSKRQFPMVPARVPPRVREPQHQQLNNPERMTQSLATIRSWSKSRLIFPSSMTQKHAKPPITSNH